MMSADPASGAVDGARPGGGPRSGRGVVACVHEDRPHCLTGAKLTILSLRERCPDLPIVVSGPSSHPSYVEWLGRQPRVGLIPMEGPGNRGWNVKPALLLRLLAQGYSQVIWVDSDIIVHRDVLTPLTRLGPETLVATEEPRWGQSQDWALRTKAWGLTPRREMPCTLNTGVLRVTPAHIPLLEAWARMLDHPLYREVQALNFFDRPVHMISDQEVLTALLGSAEFADVPLTLLRRGVEIAQCMRAGTFTPRERLRALRSGLPGLVHAMNEKPWTRDARPPAFKLRPRALYLFYKYTHNELNPYIAVARPYGPALDEDLRWMEPSSALAKVLTRLTGHSAVWQEFPIALIDRARLAFPRLTIPKMFRPYDPPVVAKYCLPHSPLQ